ncbi:hypothetical protein TNCV_4279071 [Trichonephila clavipes]|nr:hypothetical protein TNCV_4279071 [Trichonephila clavipes]
MVGEDRSFESNSSVLECQRIDSGQILTKPAPSVALLTFPEAAPEIERFSRLGYCNGFKGLWLLYLQSIGYQLPGESFSWPRQPVVKITDSWLACEEFEPCAAENPPCRGSLYSLNLSRFKHPPCTPIDADLREQILKLGPYQPEGNFQKDAKGRSFSSSYYSFISNVGQKIERKWLCYSTRLHVAYGQPENIRINETFLGFIEAANQTAKSLESDALNFLNTLDINSAKCRGQGYDGATNISGVQKLTGALYGLVESFFKNDEGHNVTVNGDRYRAMITNFFIPELNNHDVQELWFQQDGATCHTARATIDLLKDTFGDSLISRFGPVNWPPRSCDLTPLDYFLWGYVVIGLCG